MRIEAESFRALMAHGDDTLALIEAVRCIRDGDTLCLAPRTYHFYGEDAFELRKNISSVSDEGREINGSENGLRCVFYLSGKKNVTIDGNGAELIFHGNVVPFYIEECEDIVIQNFSVDYASAFFAQAAIEEADERHVLLRFDESETHCSVRSKRLVFYNRADDWLLALGRVLVLEYNAETKAPQVGQPTYFACFSDAHDESYRDLNRRLKAESVRDGRIRLTGDFGFSHTVGNSWVCIFDIGLFHAFGCDRSKNIRFSDITVYNARSKGFSARNCENVFFERCGVTTRADSQRILTTDAEGIFCCDCRGTISIEDCTIEKNMSNGVDIRSCLCDVYRVADEKSVYLRNGEGNGLFRSGDKVRLFSEDHTFDAVLTADRLESVSSGLSRLTFSQTLPEVLPEALLAENLSACPDVSLRRCAIGNNRPYAVSILTRGAVTVEDCTLYSTYSALVLGGGLIHERLGGGMSKAYIAGNRFLNCAYNGGYPIRIRGEHSAYSPYPVNHNVLIEKNTFVLPSRCFLSADSVENLVFRDNICHVDKSLPTSNGNETTPFTLIGCKNVVTESAVEEEKNHSQSE